MQPTRELAGSLIELVKQWVSGAEVSAIARQMAIAEARDMAKVLEDVCGLPLALGCLQLSSDLLPLLRSLFG
jgi:hypothetical protein